MKKLYFDITRQIAVSRFGVIAILTFIMMGAVFGHNLSASPAVKKVLILYPQSMEFPFYANFTRNLKARLQEEPAMKFQYTHETIDCMDATDEGLAKATAEVLRIKYKDSRPDIIITNSLWGANFVDTYCRDTFGATPVITYFTRPTHIEPSLRKANFTFCYPAINPAKNTEFILTVKPDTQQLFVIMGSSEAERQLREELPAQLAPFSGRLAIKYLDNLPLPEIMNTIRTVDRQSAILFVDFAHDVDGTSHIPAHIIREISAEATAPVFGSYSTHLGEGGGVGGNVLNMNALGREVGAKVVDILRGKAGLGGIEILNIAEYMADYPELARWHINEELLPPGSTVLNKPLSLWLAYKWHIISAVSFSVLALTVQTAVIMLLRRKRQKAEAALARLDRLNLVGEMAAGIGHEIRNPMTTVRGYLQMFQRKSKFAEYHDQLATMIEELDRANAIITEYLSLAKNKTIDLKPGNLNGTIHALFPLLQAEALRMGHDIETDIGDIPPVYYDDSEIRQLILNLTRNGMEAMKSGGILRIKTYQKSNNVHLVIQDTGPGIPAEVLKKIGTPFITTKENGTGLGLSVCYRIADRHNAVIEVDSASTGTTFFVQFPKRR